MLIQWIAGMSNGENYGRLLSYQFPTDRRVLGTQQVETKNYLQAGAAAYPELRLVAIKR